jgi:hypothetical protein
MGSWPEPTDATPNVLTRGEAWSAQRWLKEGLDLLRQSKKWNFSRASNTSSMLPRFVLGPYDGKLPAGAVQGLGV